MAKDFLKRVMAGDPPVYFVNELEEAAVKSLPGNEFEVKLSNGNTFVQKPVEGRLSNLVATAIAAETEIDEATYEGWPPEKNPHADIDGSPRKGELSEYVRWQNDKRAEHLRRLSKKDRKAAEESARRLRDRMDSEAGV